MATYKDGTVKLINGLQTSQWQKETRITTEKNRKIRQIVLTMEDFERILPGKRELANTALKLKEQADGLSTEEKRRLAERTGKNLTYVYHSINEDKPHNASRDMILCAMLLRDYIPNAEEASHTLLYMDREELYLETSDKSENCRNLLLRLCLDYASGNNPCPVADWLVFANSVILWFNMQLGEQLNIYMEPLEKGAPDYGFVETHSQLLREWAQQLEKVGFCYVQDYRRELLEAYMKKSEAESKEKAREKIARKANYSDDNVAYVFRNGARNVGRTTLINVAIAMGCNLDETNLLLRQVPLPALYPNRAKGDGEDAEFIQRLDPVGLGLVKRKER